MVEKMSHINRAGCKEIRSETPGTFNTEKKIEKKEAKNLGPLALVFFSTSFEALPFAQLHRNLWLIN